MTRTVRFIVGPYFARAGNDVTATIYSDGKVCFVDHTKGDHGEYDTGFRNEPWSAANRDALDLTIDVPGRVESGLTIPSGMSARMAQRNVPHFMDEDLRPDHMKEGANDAA